MSTLARRMLLAITGRTVDAPRGRIFAMGSQPAAAVPPAAIEQAARMEGLDPDAFTPSPRPPFEKAIRANVVDIAGVRYLAVNTLGGSAPVTFADDTGLAYSGRRHVRGVGRGVHLFTGGETALRRMCWHLWMLAAGWRLARA